MRIRTKLLLAYGCGLLILLVIATVGITSRYILSAGMREIGANALHNYEEYRLSIAIAALLMPVNDYLISGDPVEKTKYKDKLGEVKALIKSVGEFYDTDEPHLEHIKDRVVEVEGYAEKIFATSPKRSGASNLMTRMDQAGENAYRSHFEADKGRLTEIIDRTESYLTFVNRIMLGGAAVIIVLGIIFVFWLERSVRYPLEKLLKSVRGLNRGMWRKVEISDGGEITLLADEYNKMVDRLRSAYEGLEKKIQWRTAKLNDANKRLGVLAITDGLTGLYNHRHFYDRLEEEMERAIRYRRPLSLMIMDLDNFKHYNDSQGHLAGDGVLKGVARCISSSLREVDIVARYGGEEFAIILPEIDGAGASTLAERVRGAVEAHPFRQKEVQPGGSITISIGIATYPHDTDDFRELIDMADRALYVAKEGGRNRVEAYEGF